MNKNFTFYLTLILTFVFQTLLAGEFFNVSPRDGILRVFDDVNMTTLNSYSMTNSKGNVQGVNGLAVHPQTGVYYVIIKISGMSGRHLGTLDPYTGSTIWIGKLNENFAAITFTCDGILYGVSGYSSPTRESLFTIDTATASESFVLTLGNGDDGETISYNWDDGLIYHASGLDSPILETIDPVSLAITNISLTGDDYSAFTSFTYLGSGIFYGRTYDSDHLYSITTGGHVTDLGITDIAISIKGMQNASTMSPDCNDNNTIPLSNWGIILALSGMILLTLLFFRKSLV